MKKLKNKYLEIQDKLDLSKKYPNYFNKLILRIGLIIGTIFVLIMVAIFGFNTNYVAVDCDINSPIPCQNPWKICEGENIVKDVSCNFFELYPCEGKNCDKDNINQGDYYGTHPPLIVEHSLMIFFFIILFTFGFNHYKYSQIVRRVK